MDPRAVLLLAALAVAYSCYSVWSFLGGEDEEEDTDFQYFCVGLALAVIFWAVLLALPTVLALLWSMLLPGYRMKFRRTPGYTGWPLLGNLLQTRRSWLGAQEAGAARFGPAFKLWFGAEPHVVLTSSAACKQVVSKCPMTPEPAVPFWGEDRQLLLDGLAFARDLSYHKTLRSAWAPAFSPSGLASYHPVMVHHADRLVAALETVADTGGSVDLWSLLSRTCMAVVCACCLGLDTGSDLLQPLPTQPQPQPKKSPVVAEAAKGPPSASSPPVSRGCRVMQALQVILDAAQPSKAGLWPQLFLMLHPGLRGPVRLLANLLPDAPMSRLKQAQREVRDVARSLVQQERSLHKQHKQQADTKQQQQQQQQSSGIKAGCFLQHLLQLQDTATTGRMSDAQVAANVCAFVRAGVEGPAGSITYTVYQLALHPGCEARVLQELDAAGPSLYEAQQLPEALPFLQACHGEAMRTMTPVPTIFRQATEDIVLAGTQLAVKKGTKLQVSLRCAMRDPSAWKEPLQFRPERFMQGDVEWFNADASAFMPFGGGGRACIGSQFALNLAKLVLAKLYSRFTFELEPGVAPLRVATGTCMVPEDGMRVRVLKRL